MTQLKALASAAAVASIAFIGAASADTLGDVQARGTLNCGVTTGLAGFAAPDDQGNWTGLDVDITIGSSPSAQSVVLPAGTYGRPELTLSERWSRKGVAVAIVAAADRKSLLLLGLVLLVCVMFLGNAVAAAVRDRRRELGVLAAG